MSRLESVPNQPLSTTKDKPLISIITAVYNSGSYLNNCILSILSQTYENFEYIIIDGGSTDKTISIIRQYEEHLSYWISEPDQGIYDAWNKGLSVAKGEWIAFVGADDLLHPHALQTYVEHIIYHPNRHDLDFVSSRIELVQEDLSPLGVVGSEWTWDHFRRDMITWHVGCFHSRKMFNKYGYFNSNYKVCGDYEMLLRPKDKLVASFINKSTVRMRTGGVSNTRLFQAIDETSRAKVSNKIISPLTGYIYTIKTKARVVVKRALGRDQFKF